MAHQDKPNPLAPAEATLNDPKTQKKPRKKGKKTAPGAKRGKRGTREA